MAKMLDFSSNSIKRGIVFNFPGPVPHLLCFLYSVCYNTSVTKNYYIYNTSVNNTHESINARLFIKSRVKMSSA